MMRSARYLLAVVDHASFTRAAAALNISQPALSQHVRQLEDSLGATLLDRAGRRIAPTDAGRAYIHHLRIALRNIDAAHRAVQDVESLSAGYLRLAFLPLFTAALAGPLIAEFRSRYPGIDLSVDILAQGSMEQGLTNGRYDIGLGLGDLSSAEVGAIPLHAEEFALITGASHPFARKSKIRATELGRLDFALLDRTFITREPINRYLKANDTHPRIALESNSVDALISIVESTPLVTIFPRATAQHRPGLRAIRLDPAFPALTTSVLMPITGHQSAAAKAFLAMLRERNW